MKILFLTPQLPYPPNSGGTIKSYKLIKYLSEKYEVGLANFLKKGDNLTQDDFLNDVNIIEHVKRNIEIPRTLKSFILSIISGKPLNVYRNYDKNFEHSISTIINSYDLLFIDHYTMYQYVPSNYKGKVVLHQHNAEYIMWDRFAKLEKNIIKKKFLQYEAFRIKTYEKNICLKCNTILAAPNDIDILSKLKIEKEKFFLTYHLGNEDYHKFPQLSFENSEESLLYVGTLTWEANIDGLLWFIKNVWGKLQRLHPSIKFYIIGKNPDERLEQIVKLNDRIYLKGYVEELEEYFIKSRIFIAPLRFGSGMKVKVLSAMSRGIPTVTTTIGAEGIKAKNMQELAIFDEADKMINGINILLKDKKIWHKMSEDSRSLIQENYTWEIVYKNLELAIKN